MTIQTLKAMNVSLAQSARIFRRMEQRRHANARQSRLYYESITGGDIFQAIEQDAMRADLHRGRTHVVRKLRREHHLAYNFARGKDYLQAELMCWSPPLWEAIEEIVRQHLVDGDAEDERSVLQRFASWKDAAKAALTAAGRYDGTLNAQGKDKWIPPEPKHPIQRVSNWVKQTREVWAPPA